MKYIVKVWQKEAEWNALNFTFYSADAATKFACSILNVSANGEKTIIKLEKEAEDAKEDNE